MFQALIWVHVIAACLWIGGSLFLVGVLLPVLRSDRWAEHYRPLLRDIVLRFRSVAWGTLAVLVLTGTALTGHRLGGDFASLLDSGWGRTVAVKAGIVAVILTLAAVHDWRTGPKAMEALRADPDGAAAARLRATAMWVGRINLLLGLVVVWLAVGLPRGL